MSLIYLEALFFSSRAPDYSKHSLCLSYLEAVFFMIVYNYGMSNNS